MESEAYSGNRNAFRLSMSCFCFIHSSFSLLFISAFHDCDIGYWFFADSAREADEWIVGLQTARYCSS